MLVPEYQDRPVIPTLDFDVECLKGKSIVITGGTDLFLTLFHRV
jgi:BRCT domain type II-containing protein